MSKFAAILLAAGQSSRFKDREKKPFADLDGRAVWLRGLEIFSSRDDVSQIAIVVADEDREEFDRRFTPNVAFLSNAFIVAGGKERHDSVRNALAQVSTDIDLVAIHDAARPCVTKRMVDDVFAAAKVSGAAILACPMADTLKKSDGKNIIAETLSREHLWLAQTPQVFGRQILVDAYARMPAGARITDDAQLVEALGVKVTLVESDASNLKITTKVDLAIAAAIIRGRPKPRERGFHPFADDKLWG